MQTPYACACTARSPPRRHLLLSSAATSTIPVPHASRLPTSWASLATTPPHPTRVLPRGRVGILLVAAVVSRWGLSGLHWVWCIGRGPHLQLRQEPQGPSDFRLRSQGPCRLGTGESVLVLG